VTGPFPRVALKRVAKLGTGHTPSRSHPEYWIDRTIPWLTLADVGPLRDGTRSVVTETKEMISELGVANSSAVVHPAGTVVMSRTASVGYSAILGRDMATSQDYVTWTCGPEADPRFVLHGLRGLRNEILASRMGSTHQTIYMPDVERIRIPLPPLEEQRRIADFLDDETARIDALIAAKQQMINIVGDRSKGTIEALLEASEIIVRLDGVPSGLRGDRRLARLAMVSTVQSGITLDAGRELGRDAVVVPYLRVANVQDGYIDTSVVKTVHVAKADAGRFELRRGDVLMTEGGDPDKLGRGAVWTGVITPCLHQNHVFAVRPDPSLLDPAYLAMVTRTTYARAYFETTATKTTGIASTSASKIAAFRVPLPPLDEQRRLAGRAEHALGKDQVLTDTLARQIALLRERRQALITAAVTGELAI